jgi:hypothetical protein
MIDLKLKPGGILELCEWNSEKKENEFFDVSKHAVHYLNNFIEFDEVTVKDIFLLINKNMDYFLPIFGNWIDEFTFDALNKESSGLVNDVDYVRLYWGLCADSDGLSIPAFPNFDGIGIANDTHVGYNIGDEIKWGMSLSSVESFIHLPLILDKKVKFVFENEDCTYEEKTYDTDCFTLFQVIQGIIWEMSFYGSPQQAKKLEENMRDQIEKIKSGEIKIKRLP